MIAGALWRTTNGGRSGSTLLQDEEGYNFSLNSTQKSGLQRWQCSRKRNLKCTVIVIVDTDGVITQVGQHCHPPFKLA